MKVPHNQQPLLAVFALAVCFTFAVNAQAQTITNVYWDGDNNSTAGGSGALNTGVARWSTNGPSVGGTLVAPTSTNYILNFGGTNGAVNQSSGTITSGGIAWLTSGYTFTGNASVRTLAGVTNADGTPYGTGVMFITNDANLTIFGAGFTFSTMGVSGGSGATLTLSNAAAEQTILQFGTSSSTSGRTNAVNTVITGGGNVYIGSSGGNGFTQTGNITNSTSGLLVLSNTAGGNVTFSGSISGSGAVAITNGSATGKIVLAASNSYAGNTAINAPAGGSIYLGDSSALSTGTVTLGGAGTNYLRASTNNLNFANAAVIGSGTTLQLAATSNSWKMIWSGSISGAGGMSYAFSDNGLYLLSTNSSFGGGMNVGSSGKLYVASLGLAGANSSLGTNAALTFSSGANNAAATLLWLGTNNETSDKTISLAGVSTNANAGLKIYAGDNSTANFNGGTNVTLTLNGNISSVGTNNKTITLGAYNTNTLAVNGTINQTVGYTNRVVIDPGNIVLGNTNNSFSGGVTIAASSSAAAVLSVSKIGNIGANSSLGPGGVISMGGSSPSAASVLNYTGTGEVSDKVISLAGTSTNSISGGATLDQSGTGNLKFTSATTVSGSGAKSLTLQGSTAGTGEFAGVIADQETNVISLVKGGTGKWTLSAANTYSGGTAVDAGTLVFNNTTGSGSGTGLLTVSASATLGGSGSISGATTINGTHSPGNSPGLQTFGGDLTYNSGANFLWELTGNTTADRGVNYDAVDVSGTLTFSGSTGLNLTFNSGSTVSWADSFWSSNQQWKIFSATNQSIIGSGNFVVTTNSWADAAGVLFPTIRPDGSFTLSSDANNIYLEYTAVPEPSTYALLGMAAAGLAGYGLRRRQRAGK